MPTRTLVLLSLTMLVGCASEKSAAKTAAEQAAAGPPPKAFALTAADEVPPCPAAGPGAQGMGNVAVAPDGSSLTATVSYSGLSGPPAAAHIHSGRAGVAGPVVLPFTGDLSTSPFSKTFTAADYVANPGAPPDFASFVQGLKAAGTGTAYVNVHTAACKPGEIRGQIP